MLSILTNSATLDQPGFEPLNVANKVNCDTVHQPIKLWLDKRQDKRSRTTEHLALDILNILLPAITHLVPEQFGRQYLLDYSCRIGWLVI